jgi:hypothetical protein
VIVPASQHANFGMLIARRIAMVLSTAHANAKLETLAEYEGFADVDALLAAASTDSISPGICVTIGCDYTCDVEPDQEHGWCETCGTQTVQSALILAGLI